MRPDKAGPGLGLIVPGPGRPIRPGKKLPALDAATMVGFHGPSARVIFEP